MGFGGLTQAFRPAKQALLRLSHLPSEPKTFTKTKAGKWDQTEIFRQDSSTEAVWICLSEAWSSPSETYMNGGWLCTSQTPKDVALPLSSIPLSSISRAALKDLCPQSSTNFGSSVTRQQLPSLAGHSAKAEASGPEMPQPWRLRMERGRPGKD